MDEEMQSLRENNTFTLSSLPKGKKAVGVDGFMQSRITWMDLKSAKHVMWQKDTVR